MSTSSSPSGCETWLQVRATGDTGFRGIWQRACWARVTALLVLESVGVLAVPGAHVAGLALAGVGIVGTFLTQMEMGTNWRIGVEETERTELVTSGAFALVRNPIFTAMVLTGTGWR